MPRPEARRLALKVALLTALWMAFTGTLAATGRLRFDTVPPTLVLLILCNFVLCFYIASSALGKRIAETLPLAALVGLQGFRFPLELMMHRAYEQGLMPVQMSYEGLNLDIVTGISAIVVAGLLAAGRMPRWGLWMWNAVGIAFLINILTIAFLSAPLPFRVFMNEPANVWITQAPWVWLPTIMVSTAIIGHILITRRLVSERRSTANRLKRAAAKGHQLA